MEAVVRVHKRGICSPIWPSTGAFWKSRSRSRLKVKEKPQPLSSSSSSRAPSSHPSIILFLLQSCFSSPSDSVRRPEVGCGGLNYCPES
ncbi:unnamed protein product [Citrullus colocynthis]|uniref:Uncharacterized protein n=1 Tax=Citrullus colocynthis TaxID=252529 RepID=A0ABP0YCS7_9ROSI